MLGGLVLTGAVGLGYAVAKAYISAQGWWFRWVIRPALGPHRLTRAWDRAFESNASGFVRVYTVNIGDIAGRFDHQSWAGSAPSGDLYLAECYSLDDDGKIEAPLGHGAYVPESEILLIEFLHGAADKQDDKENPA